MNYTVIEREVQKIAPHSSLECLKKMLDKNLRRYKAVWIIGWLSNEGDETSVRLHLPNISEKKFLLP